MPRNRYLRALAITAAVLPAVMTLGFAVPVNAMPCQRHCPDPEPEPEPPDNPPPPPPRPPNVRNWAVDADTLTGVTIQENGIFSNGDEAYIAQIGFRSTPGVVGSTSAFYQGGLADIKVEKNQAVTIPNPQGRVVFSNVTSRGLGDVLAGRNPEVLGTLSVVFESDATPFGTINSIMTTVTATARAEIANVIEPLTLADLTDGTGVAARLSAASTRIQSSATPTTLQSIGIWLGSWGDPDDLVAFKANVFVAVDSSLAPLVDSQIGMAIPTSVGFGGALQPRSYSQRFSGAGATYDVGYAVSKF